MCQNALKCTSQIQADLPTPRPHKHSTRQLQIGWPSGQAAAHDRTLNTCSESSCCACLKGGCSCSLPAVLAPLPQLMLAPRQPYTCTFMVASTQAQCHKLALCPCMLGLGPCGCRAALQTNSCCTMPVPAHQAGAGPSAAGVSNALARLPFLVGAALSAQGSSLDKWRACPRLPPQI